MRRNLRRLLTSQHSVSELISGTWWAFSLKVVGLGTGYLFTLAVTSNMGAQAWGAFSITLSYITFVTILSRFGLDTALLRSVSRLRANVQYDAIIDTYLKVLYIVVPASILVSIVAYFLAPLIATLLFNKPNLVLQFRVGCLGILPIAVVSVNAQALRGLKRIRESVFLSLIARNLFALGAFFLLMPFLLDDSLVIAAFVLGAYINALIGVVLFLRFTREGKNDFNARIQNTYVRVSYRSLFVVATPLLLASSLQFIKGWTDTIMLGVYMTETDVGMYNVALKLATLISFVLVATNTIAAPKFAEIDTSHDRAELELIVQQSSKMILIISLPIFLIIVLFPEMLLGFFGAEFTDASTALVILAIAYFINAISGSVGVFLQMTGHQVFFQNITLAIVILGIVLNFILIPRLGINGAAIATCIGVVVWNLGCVWYVRHQYGFLTIYNPLSRSR